MSKPPTIACHHTAARLVAYVNSDLWRDNFKLTMIFAIAEELREILNKDVDVFEIHELNVDSEFYNSVMKERLLIA